MSFPIDRDYSKIHPLKLTDINGNSDALDLLYSLKQSLLTATTQQQPPSGYEFEGLTYLDGKQLKKYKNGQWVNDVNFASVNYSDVINAPQITTQTNETDLNKIPNLNVIKAIIDDNSTHANMLNYIYKADSYYYYELLQAGRDYVYGGSTHKVNDFLQGSAQISNSVMIKAGRCIAAPTLNNSRVLVNFAELAPEGYFQLARFCTQQGVQSGTVPCISICTDWGHRDSRSGTFFSIYDPNNEHFSWSCNPDRNYSDHAYAFDWLIIFMKI